MCVSLPAHGDATLTSACPDWLWVWRLSGKEGPWAEISGAGSVAALREPASPPILPRGPHGPSSSRPRGLTFETTRPGSKNVVSGAGRE